MIESMQRFLPNKRADLPATPRGIPEEDLATATHRVGCHACGVALWHGDGPPEGGAAAVWEANGCPPLHATPEQIAVCPNRPTQPAAEPPTPPGQDT